MNSLQTRIAVLLIVSIFSVVMLATFTATRVMQPPSPRATMEPVARQIHMTLALMGHGQPQDRDTLHPEAAQGVPDPRMTDFLRRALMYTGEPLEVQVTRREGQESLTASVPAGDDGWLVMEIPDLSPPPGRWKVLALWLTLIAIGSAAIAIHVSRRLTRPLHLLEGAADRIGPDGLIGHIPEAGTAEVRAAAKALNRLSAQLRHAMESRMRLVAAAGHDLRTPMTRMRLRAEFIEDDTDRAKWLADLEELDLIADSAIRLVREEIGADGLEQVRLDRMLGEISDELRMLGHQVTRSVLPPVSVTVGPMALKRALRNLIANAATHGGGAELAMTIEGQDAVVRILDRGQGIPEDLLDRVFEPFFRVDQARRKVFPGAGLGLAIAREIIERFGGHILIRNRQGGGLEQVCRLPCAGMALG
ncbi:ATP-binding protein [Paracoccus laeviglucosivorans]|uniref:histidine kinase n=1 Tax=Paracoccus laeviglucosivorans TaxID=1197861 RepID=A0A521FBY9_9RHOB|nr:ATP-binding protein [Paracoccus laeviglucosivorans]SMO93121.1 Signal transduction histidine kinase [Paracoccus laeviglucosivorans]